MPADWRLTSTGGDGGAFLRSMWLVQPRLRYTTPVALAKSTAIAADQRAYRAASLLSMASVYGKRAESVQARKSAVEQSTQIIVRPNVVMALI
jgi:hypothetical protein